MMGYMRGHVAKVIFGFLLVAFLSWIVLELGMQGKMGSSTGTMAAVSGETITAQEFYAVYNQEVEANWSTLKGNMGDEEEKGLRREVLDRIIDQTLAWKEARRLKYAVSRREVQAGIRGYQAFQNQQGQFDPQRFAMVLSNMGLTQEAFEKDQERSISANRVEGIIREGVRTTDDELWLEYLRWHRKMRAQVMAFPFSEARERIKVTSDEVRAYWDGNKANYMKPERVHIRHIVAAVNPQGGPEALAQARAKIDSIVAEMKKGAGFEDLAKRRSDDSNTAPRGGDLGWQSKGQLIPEYDSVAFKMRKGQVSAVFQTKFGFHVIKCDEHQSEQKPTFEDKKDEIRGLILNARAREQMLEAVQKALWNLRKEKDLVKVAKMSERPAPQTVWLERGKVKQAGPLSSSPVVEAVIAALAPLEPGEATGLVEARDGFYIASLKEEIHVKPANAEKGYMNERQEIEAAVLVRKQKAVLDSWLAGLRAKGKVKVYLASN
jgi:peptidyl-prolyl cis-trans isomerase D